MLSYRWRRKEHKIFVPESRGLIKGWDLLTAKLRELGIKMKTNEKSEGDRARVDVVKEVRNKGI